MPIGTMQEESSLNDWTGRGYWALLASLRVVGQAGKMKATDRGRRRVPTTSADPGESSAKARDLDHYDALTVVRDRCLGLRCAISGAGISEVEDTSALLPIESPA